MFFFTEHLPDTHLLFVLGIVGAVLAILRPIILPGYHNTSAQSATTTSATKTEWQQFLALYARWLFFPLHLCLYLGAVFVIQPWLLDGHVPPLSLSPWSLADRSMLVVVSAALHALLGFFVFVTNGGGGSWPFVCLVAGPVLVSGVAVPILTQLLLFGNAQPWFVVQTASEFSILATCCFAVFDRIVQYSTLAARYEQQRSYGKR